MNKSTMARFTNGAFLTTLALGLTACTDADVARILAEDPTITEDDFVGKSFPVYFSRAEAAEGGAQIGSGTAEVTFNSDTQFALNVPGEAPLTFTRVGSTDDFVATDSDGSTITVRILNFGSYGAGFLPGAFDPGATAGFDGYFGFETPVDQRPATARYNESDFSTLFFDVSNSPDFSLLTCTNCVDLQANFTTGEIDGTLFEGSGSNGSSFGVEVVNTLDGSINATGYTGTVTTDITFTEAGEETVRVVDNLNNQSFQGVFFGPNAEAAAFAYDGQVSIEGVPLNMAGSGDALDSTTLD